MSEPRQSVFLRRKPGNLLTCRPLQVLMYFVFAWSPASQLLGMDASNSRSQERSREDVDMKSILGAHKTQHISSSGQTARQLQVAGFGTQSNSAQNHKKVVNVLNHTVSNVLSSVKSTGLLSALQRPGPMGLPLWHTVAVAGIFLLVCCMWSCVAGVMCAPHGDEFSSLRRRPTDMLCLTVFVCFLCCMAYILHYASVKGDPRRLTHGFNFRGQLCGVDPDVVGQPLLFWCQNSNSNWNINQAASSLVGASIPINFNSPICIDTCPTTNNFLVLCPQPSQASTAATQQANGNSVTITTIKQELKMRPSYKTKQMMGIFCMPDVPHNSTLFHMFLTKTSMNGPLQKTMLSLGSLRRATDIFIYSVVAALFLSFAYILLLSKLACFFVYMSLGLTFVFMLGLSLYCLVTAYSVDTAGLLPHNKAASNYAFAGSSAVQKYGLGNPLFQLMDSTSAVICSYIISFLGFLIVLTIMCITCCCFKSLNLAIKLVDAAADCMMQMTSMIVEAIIDMVLRISVLCALMLGLFWVISCGSVHSDAGATIGGQRVTGVTRSMTFTRDEKYMIVFYIFGCFWIMEVLHALSQFVISYMVVMWYYTPKQEEKKVAPWFPLPKAYLAAITCHLGSLAVGSFIIAVVRLAKLLLGGLAANARNKGNKVLECVASALGCILECFQHCMEFVNKNAYIDVALNNSNFCNAAKHSFEFMLSNASEIVVLNGSCLIFQVSGVVIVVVLTGLGSYTAVTHMTKYTSNTSPSYVANPLIVAILASAMGGLVAMVFMVVFDQAADTLLYTYTWSKSKQPDKTQEFAPQTLLDIQKNHGYVPLPQHEDAHANPNRASANQQRVSANQQRVSANQAQHDDNPTVPHLHSVPHPYNS